MKAIPPYRSLNDLFARRAQGSRSTIFHSDGLTATRRTMGDIYALGLKIGRFLTDLDLPRGSYVALMSGNRPEWLAIYMGIIHAGHCALTIDPHLSRMEVKNLIQDSKASVFFIERGLFGSIRDAELEQKVKKFIVLDAEINYLSKCIPFSWIEKAPQADFRPVETGLEDEASLIYTSGTTGQPKGVVLKHKNLLSQVKLGKPLGVTDRSRVLLVLPLNHAYALSSSFLVPLEARAGIYIFNSFKKPDLLRCIQDNRLTHITFVPAILTQIHKGIMEKMSLAPNSAQFLFHFLKSLGPLSGDGSRLHFLKRRLFRKVHDIFGGELEAIISGAAGLDEDIARTFNTLGLPLYEGYGLTETSPVVSFNYPGRNRPGTVGRPLPDVELKIQAPAESGIGEIAVKGAPVFGGYKSREATDTSAFDSEGYFLTGDLGRIDGKGFLTISGRSKDVIVLPSGKNVFPSDIEDFYLQSDCLKEIAVLGIPREFGKKAEEIYAVLVPNLEFFRSHNIADIEGFVKNTIIEMSDKLPGWCRINRYAIRYEALPRTPTNKVKKFLLREQILEQMSRNDKTDVDVEAESLLDTPIGRILDASIARVKGGKMRYSVGSHLFLDLGFDSLSVSEFIVSLEGAIGAEIPKETAYQMRTVGDCITLLGEFCSQHQIDPKALALPAEGGNKNATSWSEVLKSNVSPEVERETALRLQHRSRIGGFFRRVLIGISSVIGALLFRFKATGLENLPHQAPFILAADHFNYIDALFVLWALPRKFQDRLFCIGKREHLHHLHRVFFGWLVGMIPVDRSGNFVPSLQTGQKVIENDQILLIFPEGTRSKDACINDFKSGVGILSETTGATVVPIHLEGTHDITRPERKMPRFCKVRASIGRPVAPAEVRVAEGEERCEAITDEVRSRIIQLGAKTRNERRAEIRRARVQDRPRSNRGNEVSYDRLPSDR